jgi:hypothetical protein
MWKRDAFGIVRLWLRQIPCLANEARHKALQNQVETYPRAAGRFQCLIGFVAYGPAGSDADSEIT